ncbi:MAG: hypothetical protein M1829_003362 [Trizodia sp. TS-e1964]|nr:MAG: hypothetical protein M1829_003362 [Trizodia sp. TS-e1964]
MDLNDYEEEEPLIPRPVPLVPPLSFAMVSPGLYRSGHPLEINFPMLENLHLRTIVYLADQEYAEENIAWCAQHNIQIYHFRMRNVRDPSRDYKPALIVSALKIVEDRRNFPILLHSNKGKHRVGVLVGCMRKVHDGWSMPAIHAEYDRFSGEKGEADLEFIQGFELEA